MLKLRVVNGKASCKRSKYIQLQAQVANTAVIQAKVERAQSPLALPKSSAAQMLSQGHHTLDLSTVGRAGN